MIYKTRLLPSGYAVSFARNGEIQIADQITGECVLVTSAAELAYILQLFQDGWGGIPVSINLADWHALEGKPR